MIKKPGTGSVFAGDPWKSALEVGSSDNFFAGAFNNNEYALDPLLSGYSFIFWTKLPGWVTAEYPRFAQFMQRNLRGFGGITNFELSAVSVQAGFTANETDIAGSITKGKGFTTTHKEYSGSPIRNALTHWVTGIRDPNTGIARYPKEYPDHSGGGVYSMRYHTGELLYVQTRPDADNVNGNIIEFAQYYTGVMPLIVPRDHHNFTAGTNDQTDLEITWAGTPHQSAQVDEFASKKLQAEGNYKFITEGEFTSGSFA